MVRMRVHDKFRVNAPRFKNPIIMKFVQLPKGRAFGGNISVYDFP